MLDFLELEETVGKAWHRLVGTTASMPRYPDQAVRLDELKSILGSCFRAFGGEPTVQLSPSHVRTSSHRLRLRQLIGLGEEKVAVASRDIGTVMLPPVIDLYPERRLNRDLYLWLSAVMAVMPLEAPDGADPLQRDLMRIEASGKTVARALQQFPGLRATYKRLCQATLAGRRRGTLPPVEKLVESRIIRLLKQGADIEDSAPQAIFPRLAPPGYQPMMAVPLWPDFECRGEVGAPQRDEDGSAATVKTTPGSGRFRGERNEEDAKQGERSPFILNRFEKILAMAEMVNVDRPTDDDDDPDDKAADDLDDIRLGQKKERPSSKFRFDLDLPPEMVDLAEMSAEVTYPEWNYRKAAYMPDYCRVLAVPAAGAGVSAPQTDETRNLIRRVRRQFEILRPKRDILKSQFDGAELDLDAVVRMRTDLAAGGQGSDRIHLLSRPQTNDLAVTILVDVSLSTDAWLDNRRVLDVEKEALLVLTHGLAACGNNHSILTFTSRRRSWVRIETVKAYGEPVNADVESRIAGLKPGYYTRLGAAIRHATAELAKQPNRKRLLLVLTDGKPNDVDHYEGRFALEDSRRAVIEARRAGTNVFAVTVDKDARSYLPGMFGQNGFALVGEISKLPSALPAIYRGLTG
jgi:nitric oxide reductase NorD protein